MIWNSVISMTVIDIIIIIATGVAAWSFLQNRSVLKQLHAIRPVVLMLTGLSIIALFYLADLMTMFALPLWMPMKKAMAIMTDLHLNLKWVVSLGGVGFIVVGLFHLIRTLFPKIIAIQNKLVEKESYLDSILQSSLDQAIVATDNNYVVKYFNSKAEKLFEYAPKEAMERSVLDFHAQAKIDPARFEAGIQAVRKSGEYCYSVQRGEGESARFLESRVSGIWNQDKKLIGYILNSQDVTERRAITQSLRGALEEAKTANRAKSVFLATMSHEIRNPMNAILGMAEILRDTDLNKEQQEYVQIFEKAGRTLLALINDILDLSKIEADRIELEKVDFNLVSTVNNVVQIFKGLALEKGLNLSYEISPKTPRALVGDELRLQQILFNLVSNAIKFTERGDVRIDVRNSHQTGEEGTLLFSVTDTGIGVPTDRQKIIFSAFTQEDVSTSRRFGGTGLGLAICNKLVELMCGRLFLTSVPGKGSTFSFTARFVVRDPAETGMLTREVASRSILETVKEKRSRTVVRPLRILLVDDTKENLLVLRAFLKKEPHDIEFANNGQEALDKMMASRYDLTFMDMQMPVLDGYSATQRFRTWERENNRKPSMIIALSAFAMKEDVKKAMAIGCDIYLSKPIRKQSLLDTIMRCP